MIHQMLKELRQRTGMSVRAVAEELGYETHSKYAYYESARFKGPLPLPLAKKLAAMWQYLKVDPVEVLQLAGLEKPEAAEEFSISQALKHQPAITMKVHFPDTESLELMFQQIFAVLDEKEAARRLSHALAVLLPDALQHTPTWRDDPDRSRIKDDELLIVLKRRWERYTDFPF